MRRHLIEEPASRAAAWSRRVGAFAWLSLAVSLLLARFGKLKPYDALSAVIGCGGLAVIAILLALFAFTVIWRKGARGLPQALTGLFLGAALLAYPIGLGLRDLVSPPALDLTTDLADPPQPLEPLRQLAEARTTDEDKGKDVNPWRTIAASRLDAGLPKAIAPLTLDTPMNDALALALRAAGQNGWHVTSVDYPHPPKRDQARFAATVPSLLIRWPSDAVVRLQQTEDGIRIDARLIARQPWSLLHNVDADISSYFDRLETLTFGKRPHAGR